VRRKFRGVGFAGGAKRPVEADPLKRNRAHVSGTRAGAPAGANADAMAGRVRNALREK
jgi:hypothetical protein